MVLLSQQRGLKPASKQTHPKLRLIGRASAVVMLFGVTACSSYVKIPQLQVAVDPNIFPEVSAFVNAYEQSRATGVQAQRDRNSDTRQALNFALFGAGLGAGVSALFDAHRDVPLGFGVAGASSFAFSNLFSSKEREAVLNSANQALSCVAEIGDSMVGTAKSLAQQNVETDKIETSATTLLAVRDWSGHATIKGNAELALNAYAVEKRNFEIFKGLDSSAAARLRKAARLIISKLNKELEKLSPSPEAVSQIARSLGTMSVAFADNAAGTAVAAFGAAGFAAAPRPAPSATEVESLKALTVQLNDAAQAIKTNIKGPVNALASIDTSCAFTPVTIADLTASQTEVTVAKDVKVAIQIDGGLPPLKVQWIGTTPPAKTVVLDPGVGPLNGRRITLFGGSELVKDKEFKLRVGDSLGTVNTIDITIKTTGP